MNKTPQNTEEKNEPVGQDSKAQEYLDNWKRERADFLNYKKDEARRMGEMLKYANEDVILEVLEILDDLELAAKELKGVGLEQIIRKFTDLFKKYGVERIEVDGKTFNPEIHEAIETEPGGEKIAEIRAGYTLNGKVIRPARVKITK
ncbi:MAG TPA: nucleotide exchange factor GrpE [Candidatus Paceibacterota bacterium]|nr:nucleotide exchange factor GrpE [Candidatus Paceibacterota bacterium]